jgi:hypothetical protein
MASRRIFAMSNEYWLGAEGGICTVASLHWAKKCLQLGRGIGSFAELAISVHQLNALMAVWRRHDGNPAIQTAGMGLRLVAGDIPVTQMIDVQRHANLTAPHVCIFWTAGHTMGYRVSTRNGRECDFFDIETGLWTADNDSDIRQTVLEHYPGVVGVRIVTL